MFTIKLIIALYLIVTITDAGLLRTGLPYGIVHSPTFAYSAPTAYVQKHLVPAIAHHHVVQAPIIKTYTPAILKSYTVPHPIVYAHHAPTIIKTSPVITTYSAPTPIIKTSPIFTTYSAPPTPIIKEAPIIFNTPPHNIYESPVPILKASPHVFHSYDVGAHILKHEHSHQEWNPEPAVIDAIYKSQPIFKTGDYGTPYTIPSNQFPQW